MRINRTNTMSVNAGLTKQKIRSKIFLKLKRQKEEEERQKSSLIKEKLLRTKVYKKAKVLMCYIALKGEVDTQEMIKQAKKTGKIVTVPVCKKAKATLMPCILDENAGLKKGPYGVIEPAVEQYVCLDDIDLVIVPGVAFDKKGNRLGRGKGFYDRFLNRLSRRTATIGLAFDFQILPSLPASSHDAKVSKVIFA